ncbi:uncharacterized protein LOC130417698 [Triplophysa dalaica]|uniref:uncharacterized protein LOC130417698 n=1 Tax=Triplophysa dalaica TaxID=1582913 RepID=UPI0024DF977F|nr:uncharacterized protein LOC130417698 [Triplophysa dalaica]
MEKLIQLILLSGLVSIQGNVGTSKENVALKGTVTQSSTHLNAWVAQRAIYGLIDKDTFCSVTLHEMNSWWRLDLLSEYEIGTVIITNRGDGWAEQTSGAEIRIGNSLDNNGNNNPICVVIPDLQVGTSIIFSCNGMVGRYVNVVMPTARNLSLCEVEVYGTENFAWEGTTTLSSTLSTNYTAAKAIDGVRYGPGLASCSVATFQSNPWWSLDLLNEYEISTVIISNRGICCAEHTNGAEIRIGNSIENNGNNNPICAVIPELLVKSTVSFSCIGMKGRYVNVLMPTFQRLALCEVEVYGTENLALKGTATLSSTYSTNVAANAIDGQRYRLDIAPTCSLTSSEMNPWWSLDLLDDYEITTVIISNRRDGFTEQTSGAEIRIGDSFENNGNNNPICAVIPGLQVRSTVSFSCYGMVGRYVNVVMSGRISPLSLCEVEVHGAGKLDLFHEIVYIKKTFLRLKFSSSGDVAAESDKILHQLQSALGLNISDFKLSWTQLPKKEKKEEEQMEDGGEYTHFNTLSTVHVDIDQAVASQGVLLGRKQQEVSEIRLGLSTLSQQLAVIAQHLDQTRAISAAASASTAPVETDAVSSRRPEPRLNPPVPYAADRVLDKIYSLELPPTLDGMIQLALQVDFRLGLDSQRHVLQWRGVSHSVIALIDSGAEGDFIDIELAKRWKIPGIPLTQFIAVETLCGTPLTNISSTTEPEEPVDLTGVPRVYHDLRAVFSKSRVTSLPPHRPYDCAIDLLPGTSPPKGCLYPLSGPEREAMERYMADSLLFGIIRSSSAGAGFFFVEKKDGSLRPCIDYRGLNDITVKNSHWSG